MREHIKKNIAFREDAFLRYDFLPVPPDEPGEE